MINTATQTIGGNEFLISGLETIRESYGEDNGTPLLFLPGKSPGWRRLMGCSPWDRKEWDTSELLHFHLSLSCIGEGSGNPLQCSCLENPRDGWAWWAAVYGVAQSRTRLKRLSSSSSSSMDNLSSTKEARIYNGLKTISLTSGAGKTGQPLVKKWN